jgi:methionyl aminopeptidase
MINVKNNNELSLMREAGKRTATILHMVASKVAPGVTTKELDEYAAELANQFEGKCAFNGYHGFSGNICSSINDEVVHGVPGKRVIRDGDIVSIDFGLIYDGYIGDTAVTVPAGNISQEWDHLLKVTKESLYAGINKAIEGNRLSDISNAIQKVAENAGFSIVKDYVGHGIGKNMHEEPQIPNFGPPGRGPLLKKGMTFAIEPMINLGSSKTKVMHDGWTVATTDGNPSAHFEHTIAVGIKSAEILTIPNDEI